MSDFDVLVAGELNPDLILSAPHLEARFGQEEVLVESAELTVGSSSAIFACGVARLGLRVAFVGVLGDDRFGRFMRESLEGGGIDLSAVQVQDEQRTGLSVILSRGTDRAILTFPGTIGALRVEQVGEGLLRRARHLHVGSYFLQTALKPDLPDLFRQARELGLTTSLDTNWDPSKKWMGVGEVLRHTDIFLPNQAEALAVSASETLVEAVDALARLVPTVAVKLGTEGAVARRGQEQIRSPVLPAVVADTVGAGDSFDAGFVFGALNGWPLRRTLELAVACGSLSTRAHGGTAAQPTLSEALQALEDRADDPAG